MGEKTAAKLLNQYGSLHAIIAAAGEQTPKLKAAIVEHADRVVRNSELMRLRRDVPIEIDYGSYVPRPDLAHLFRCITVSKNAHEFALSAAQEDSIISSKVDFGFQPRLHSIFAVDAISCGLSPARRGEYFGFKSTPIDLDI
ncbi:MAG: hypothetical protein EBW15_09530 [Actinobacteria bacterium]|nr:hypothetical protein [Actinomycetota bacterium]